MLYFLFLFFVRITIIPSIPLIIVYFFDTLKIITFPVVAVSTFALSIGDMYT